MTTYLLKGGNVLDVDALKLHRGMSVLVRDGRIESVEAKVAVTRGVTVIDVSGLILMPGLIDLHVHAVASSFNLGFMARMPNALAALRAVPLLKGMLMRGFTTIRDAGGADYSLAEAVRTGVVPGPRIFPSGKALSQTGGHGDFRARNDTLEMCACGFKLGNIARVVDGVDNCRQAVREELLKGATQIKIMGSGGVASSTDKITNLGFSEAEIRAIVEEASNAGTYVMAHAYTAQAIARAARCGVRTIEHGNLVDPEAIAIMKNHGTYMVPTLVTFDALALKGKQFGLPAPSFAKIDTVRSGGRKALELLEKSGVKIGFGTDLLGEAQDMQSDEFRIRAEVLGNGPVLQQATCIAAEILGQSEDLGRIRKGARADIIAVDGNPLEQIDCLSGQGEHFKLIMKEGELFKCELAAVSPSCAALERAR